VVGRQYARAVLPALVQFTNKETTAHSGPSSLCPTQAPSLRQFVEQGLSLLQVERVEALSEPVIDRREKIAGLLSLTAPQPSHARRRAQLPRRCRLAPFFLGCLPRCHRPQRSNPGDQHFDRVQSPASQRQYATLVHHSAGLPNRKRFSSARAISSWAWAAAAACCRIALTADGARQARKAPSPDQSAPGPPRYAPSALRKLPSCDAQS